MKRFFKIILLAMLCLTSFNELRADVKPIKITSVTASASYKQHLPENAIDGNVSDKSRWIGKADKTGKAWLALKLASRQRVGGIHLYSGYQGASPINTFHLEYRDKQGEWRIIPSSQVTDNNSPAIAISFDGTVEVNPDALRLVVEKTPDNFARILEIRVWPEGELPELEKVEVERNQNALSTIYLNQSGFNLGKPKRFTAPTLPDQTPFTIHAVGSDESLYAGKLDGHIGDFSDFNPQDDQEYVIKAGGATSVPFSIGPWHFERIVYQPAIDFMVDTRHYVGNYTKKCRGSFSWRDDHHFAWVLRTLVPQYLSNPEAYRRMPKQITYQQPKPGLWGALEPYDADAPDIVKMIHWAADVTLTQGLTHEMLKGELAYFLYAWPAIEQWLPQQNYDAVLNYIEKHWETSEADRKYPYDTSPEHNLFALKTKLGTTKGELPPGHSVLPNLLMFAVADRDGLKKKDEYFDAAYRQVDWMIKHLDWEDPQVTKGQRMSEHITMTSLAAFLQLYPDRAPAGLEQKIESWVEVVVRRSQNMWDFRRLADDGNWTPTGTKHTHWNEPGNVVGLPAAILAAAPYVEDTETLARLNELVWSHMDNCFGRNPAGRHFSYDAPREIEGVEYGWYSFYPGGIGQLAQARFVIDGAPKHVHYPYQPDAGNYGWTEGWVTFNTAFNISLAYMARADIELTMEQEEDDLIIRLQGPIAFNQTDNKPIRLKVAGKRTVEVSLNKESPESQTYVGKISLRELQLKPGDTASTTYGYGYMATSSRLQLR